MHNVAYVDDNLDTQLSEYLDKKYGDNYYEFRFKSTDKYEDLLKFIKEKEINILIIDSYLFEIGTAGERLTGDEFLIVLRKIYPFIETLLISANDVDNEITIKKYKPSPKKSFEDYCHDFDIKLEIAENHIRFVEKTLDSLKKKGDVDEVLIEKIEDTINKMTDYQELKKDDIDKLIEMFKDIEAKINEGL